MTISHVFPACVLLAITSLVSATAGTPPSKPNILFLFADDWGYGHAGILGDPTVKTPAIDRVVREGVLFSNAYVSSPSCTPSRGAILTGQHF
ncbi:MAG: sulfatase-like hydrolase/transferase [Luteolibacter sp.]